MHNDVQPANFFLCRDKRVVLLDFALASTEPTHGNPGSYYRAPELTCGQKGSFGSDMWSLGVIIYELMTRTRFIDDVGDPDEDIESFEDQRVAFARLICRVGTSPSKELLQSWGIIPRKRFEIRQMVAAQRGIPPYDATLPLLSRIFLYNPSERILAAEALQDPYFQVDSGTT